MKLFLIFYNLFFVLVFCVVWPVYAQRMWKRGRFFEAFGERFGFYSDEIIQKLKKNQSSPVWIHAVSVGEMMIATALLRELRKRDPHQAIVLTTTTVTGRQVGEKLIDDNTTLIYYPIDFYFSAARAFRAIRPSILLLIEQEIWPNTIWRAYRKKVPVWIINARLSDRSAKRFAKFRRVTRPLLQKISLVTLQDENDRERLTRAGFSSHLLWSIGSMKFDVAELNANEKNLADELRLQLGWGKEDFVLLAGSTHSGEEEIFLRVFNRIKKEFPKIRLVLAPRHMERSGQVTRTIEEMDIPYVKRTDLLKEKESKVEGKDISILLLDTTGELSAVYELGSVNFIGKSLMGHGGQNFLEAARVGKPVVVGPHMENFRRLIEWFQQADALIQIEDEDSLFHEIKKLSSDRERCLRYGERAQKLYRENLGASKKTVQMLNQWLNAKS